jgi:hypothetical protein
MFDWIRRIDEKDKALTMSAIAKLSEKPTPTKLGVAREASRIGGEVDNLNWMLKRAREAGVKHDRFAVVYDGQFPTMSLVCDITLPELEGSLQRRIDEKLARLKELGFDHP